MIHETPLNRILPDVFEFLFQFLSVTYHVVETFIAPDGTLALEQLVYLAGRSALNTLKHLAQLVRFNESSRLRKKAFRTLLSLSVISPRGGELKEGSQFYRRARKDF